MGAPAENHVTLRKRHALQLFAGLPRQYQRTGAIMSFGQDPRWRRAMVAAVAPGDGESILDVAAGTGLVSFELARRCACRVTALDQSSEMLAEARRALGRQANLRGTVRFVTGQAERLPFADGSFDALTFTYLLRYVDDPAATMRELVRVVRPGGRIGMVEFGVPSEPVLRALWRVYTRRGLPLIGAAVSPAWAEVGRFLGPNIESFHGSYPDLVGLWRQAGVTEGRLVRMSFGAGMVMSGRRA